MFRIARVLPLLLAIGGLVIAQMTDGTNISRPPTGGLTICDEIKDPQERSAFRSVWDEKDPQKQRALATSFERLASNGGLGVGRDDSVRDCGRCRIQVECMDHCCWAGWARRS